MPDLLLVSRESEPRMPSVQVQSHISIDELLHGVAQLEALDLEQFVSKVLALRARRIAPSLGQEEARLLERINRTLSPDDQQRYDELTSKLREETLSASEQQELLAMTCRIEQSDADRVRALTDLAQLRGTAVDALMTDLGIHPRPAG